jgi:signal transduction histidine kinase
VLLDEVTIESDQMLLEIVWNNLISNAVKFTPEGGATTVKMKNEGGFAIVTVSDTGCGMDAETLKHIFDKFYQGDTSHSGEGNGLGLALVKKALDLCGGSIDVESEIGHGSRFIVRLPA